MPPKYDHGDVIIRFSDASFDYGEKKHILDEVSFSMREGAKVALMGQNGAGKTTLFQLILGEQHLEEGDMHIRKGATISIGRQVIKPEQKTMNVRDFFESQFGGEKIYNIDPRIDEVLEIVNLHAPLTKKIGEFSGGQQARLLLAAALITKPDILLLDEPTNNLDHAGIDHLTKFLQQYDKTCLVISHDADFLNAFTHGVLYLDSHTHKVEQYVGDYSDVVKEITARIERERRENARLARDISNRKEQFNFFAQKGGHMRDVARKMREAIEVLEENVVDTRQEDKTIAEFAIPSQELDAIQLEHTGPIVKITGVNVIAPASPKRSEGGPHKPGTSAKMVSKKTDVALRRGDKLLIKGPNGIGKSTFLNAIATGEAKGVSIIPGVRLGYYRQDFSGLDFDKTVYKTLAEAAFDCTDAELRSAGARFMLTHELMNVKVGALSEGQKGLLAFAQLVLSKPGVLVMDEPTNHINFRHLPVIARALDRFTGVLIFVSHMPEFVKQIKVTQQLDLGDLAVKKIA
jgi:ATPase subunit of ABC transporter with duplicated ATPase domains